MRGEKGFALVITLIVTALLVALLVEFVNEVYVDTSHSHNFVASQQASILAQSGIQGGIKLLQYSPIQRGSTEYSTLSDIWAKPFTRASDEGSVTITIEEETGKFNINTATASNGTPNPYTDVAKRLLKNLKLSPDLTDVVMDWVDENETPMSNGAETSYYSTLKPPYKSKGARLETFGELGLLKGFTPEVLLKLRPYLTVYGGQDNETATPININTAPKEVLQALDDSITDDIAQRIVDWRKTTPITKTNHAITGVDTIWPKIVTNIVFAGSVYRIHAEGKVGESTSVAEAVVRMGGSTPTVLYWREY